MSKRVEEALHQWNENKGSDTMDALIQVLYEEMKKGLEVLLPVLYMENAATPEADQSITFVPQQLELESGNSAMPVFTTEEQMNLGEESSYLVLPLKEVLQKAIDDTTCFGVVLNPWEKGILLPKPILCNLVAALTPISQADMDFKEGYDAFLEQDYDKALYCYLSAAKEGHIEAMRNLGYLYCYIADPANYAEAKKYWEAATMKGDIPSTYLLGDLYRNGQTEFFNEERAKALYRTAYLQSRTAKDDEIYPHVCLRILKYARDGFERDKLLQIAEECMDALKFRIAGGDTMVSELEQEAEKLHEALLNEEQ